MVLALSYYPQLGEVMSSSLITGVLRILERKKKTVGSQKRVRLPITKFAEILFC